MSKAKKKGDAPPKVRYDDIDYSFRPKEWRPEDPLEDYHFEELRDRTFPGKRGAPPDYVYERDGACVQWIINFGYASGDACGLAVIRRRDGRFELWRINDEDAPEEVTSGTLACLPSAGELVEIIDSNDWLSPFPTLEMNLEDEEPTEDSLRQLEGFVEVESDAYPGVRKHYEREIRRWFAEQRKRLAES